MKPKTKMKGTLKLTGALALLCLSATAILSSAAQAEGCPNEAIRAQEKYALSLPDCRAYEQVSPVDKDHNDALDGGNLVASSPSGGAVAYFSILPFPGGGGAAEFPTYISARGGESWASQSVLPMTGQSGGVEEIAEVNLISEDLAYSVDAVYGPAEQRKHFFLRDTSTGGERELFSSYAFSEPIFAAMPAESPGDTHLLFTETTSEELVPGVVDSSEEPYVYEWDEGKISLIAPSAHLGAANELNAYTQNVISADGRRVFYTSNTSGAVLLRENGTTAEAATIPVSTGAATYLAATPNGAYAFYSEGGELYRFDAETDMREVLTRPTVAGEAKLLGTLGVAADGSYVYFVAEGVLGAEAVSGAPQAGAPNVYVWHEGAPLRFIATLSAALPEDPERARLDEEDWTEDPANSTYKSSRVTPAGTVALFTSVLSLTGYDNSPPDGKCEGEHGCEELYTYNYGTGGLTCVSCNPIASPASANALLTRNAETQEAAGRSAFLTRNLSEDGTRIFFQTNESLVPADTNGVADVYEWEREDSGACEAGSEGFSESNGGCLYLISTGTSSRPSSFGDASASGNDVFLFTRQQLVGQDKDENIDVYDARVEGGIPAQSPPLSPAPCTGEACLAPVSGAPSLSAPSTVSLVGAGNLVPPPPATAVKPRAKAPTTAQQLKKALVRCRRKHTRARPRKTCEAQARRKYTTKARAKQGRASASNPNHTTASGERHS